MDEAAIRVAKALARHEYESPSFHDDLQANILRRGPVDIFIERRWEKHLDKAKVAIAAYKRMTLVG